MVSADDNTPPRRPCVTLGVEADLRESEEKSLGEREFARESLRERERERLGNVVVAPFEY